MGRPFTGAWIETVTSTTIPQSKEGRPFTGAWIETGLRVEESVSERSPLHGGVD